MSKFQFPINEMNRAAATVLLSAGVATAYITVMSGAPIEPAARASTAFEVASLEPSAPERPAGGRRWRSSNAEQSLPTLTYYGEPVFWGRNRAALEGAMTCLRLAARSRARNSRPARST